MSEEEESMKKIERIILDLNKNGLSYLTNCTSLNLNIEKSN